MILKLYITCIFTVDFFFNIRAKGGGGGGGGDHPMATLLQLYCGDVILPPLMSFRAFCGVPNVRFYNMSARLSGRLLF